MDMFEGKKFVILTRKLTASEFFIRELVTSLFGDDYNETGVMNSFCHHSTEINGKYFFKNKNKNLMTERFYGCPGGIQRKFG